MRAAVGKRQRFSATDKRAIQMFGREEFRPIIDGITIGLQVLLVFIGTLTLGIGGVGVMNIMLVSVDERIREIGLRRALGARRRHIRVQFLAEALVLTLLGGRRRHRRVATWSTWAMPILPVLGPLFEDTTGQGRPPASDLARDRARLVADPGRRSASSRGLVPGAAGLAPRSRRGAALRVGRGQVLDFDMSRSKT